MDRLYKLVWEKVNEGPEFKRKLFSFAYEYKRKNYEAGFDTPLCDMWACLSIFVFLYLISRMHV